MAWGGLGIAHHPDGRVILLEAPLALFPGEEVEAEVRWRVRHGEGRVLRWIRKDARRGPSGCAVAAICGGCDLREGGAQTSQLKRLMVEDLLRRQMPEVRDWTWVEAPTHTSGQTPGSASDPTRRHRIQVHWDGKELGFHQRHSHTVVPVSTCPAAADPLCAALPRMKEALQEKLLPTKAQRWELTTGTPGGQVWACLEDGRTWSLEPDGWKRSEEPVSHHLCEGTLLHRAGGFFQVCAPWAAQAFRECLDAWSLKGGVFYDLFGGVGLFSLLLGSRFRHRVLVEFEETAVAFARRNLDAAGLSATCYAADVAAWVPEGLGMPEDLVLLDPPRAGLDPELCAKLLTAKARTLVLVGCDGAAFCRDLRRLTRLEDGAPEKAQAWNLAHLRVLDLFPHTSHAEFVALLER